MAVVVVVLVVVVVVDVVSDVVVDTVVVFVVVVVVVAQTRKPIRAHVYVCPPTSISLLPSDAPNFTGVNRTVVA